MLRCSCILLTQNSIFIFPKLTVFNVMTTTFNYCKDTNIARTTGIKVKTKQKAKHPINLSTIKTV